MCDISRFAFGTVTKHQSETKLQGDRLIYSPLSSLTQGAGNAEAEMYDDIQQAHMSAELQASHTQIEFDGLHVPVCNTTNMGEVETHAALQEIDWLVEFLTDENVVYLGAGLGLWPAHIATKARSVKVHDRCPAHMRQALCVAWANHRDSVVGLSQNEELLPTYHDRPVTVVLDLSRENRLSVALAHNPKRIVVFRLLDRDVCRDLLNAGYCHQPEYSGAVVFEKMANADRCRARV